MTCVPPPSKNWLLFGSETAPTLPLTLRAGPLHLLYEPASGFVRRVCLGQHEILRGIYAAVRDRNWGTVLPRISNVRSQLSEEGFEVTFDVECRQGDIHFVWRGIIRGESNGTLCYGFDGLAQSTFLRNRIGLCLLHPIRECAGVAARQQRVDGSVVEGRFPETIEPQIFGQSSFRDLRAVAHEVAPGLWAEVEFEGETFEMEDQRNWTDASFKTYGPPLARPFPVEIRVGTRVQQRVTLRLRGMLPTAAKPQVEIDDPAAEVVTITIPDSPVTRVPRLGLGLASHGEELTDAEIARLRALRLAHLRADLRLASPSWPAAWERAVGEAEQLGLGLELALHLPREGEGDLAAVKRVLARAGARLARVLALREGEAATRPATLAGVRQALAGIDVPVGAGSDANFCELNRERALGRLALAGADFVFWSITPQIHAFDDLSIFETLAAQPDTVKTARAFAGGKPMVISPLTLKPRFNAVATGDLPPLPPGEPPPPVDPRQLSLLGAAWTLGSLAALAGAGAANVTFYETTGWRGVMERAGGSSLPDKFPSRPGGVFPVYHLLAEMAGVDTLKPTCVSAPARVAALSVFDDQERGRILLANLTPKTQRIRLPASGTAVQAHALDVGIDAVASRMREPVPSWERVRYRIAGREDHLELDLPPHGLVRLVWRQRTP